jgi:hypothetical protein
LAPYGLTRDTFLARQRQLRADFVAQLCAELTSYRVPESECLFVGADPTGTHIYKTINDQVFLEDVVGFAAIGGGARHAESYLMLQRHVRTVALVEGLVSAYFSKRRAETAPGVGVETDMFAIGPALGQYVVVHQTVLEALRQIYDQERASAAQADHVAREAAQRFVNSITVKPAPQAPSPAPTSTSALSESPQVPRSRRRSKGGS